VSEKIKAVIFDMGGVFLRSDDLSPREALAKSYGLTRLQLEDLVFDSESAIQATVGKISAEQHWKFVCDSLSVPETQRNEFQDTFWKGDQLDLELITFLGSLRPERKTGLLSNAWTGAKEALIHKHNLPNVFDVVIFSYEISLAKPDQAIYQLILSKLEVQPGEAIFLDDNKQNIVAACKLGIHGIQFKNHNQAIQDIQALL
jgi:epoxide hydrolase-like predicted phosphatase